MKQQVKIHNIVLAQQILQTDIMILLQQINIAELGPSALPRHVGKSVACPGTDPYDIRKTDAPVHKAVEHAAGKHTTHASTFEHQSRTVVYLYCFLHIFI